MSSKGIMGLEPGLAAAFSWRLSPLFNVLIPFDGPEYPMAWTPSSAINVRAGIFKMASYKTVLIWLKSTLLCFGELSWQKNGGMGDGAPIGGG